MPSSGMVLISCWARNAGDKRLGRRTRGVQAGQLARLRVPIDDEEIASHARHHGLRNAQNRIRRDGCIHGRSAASQDLRSGLRRQNLAGGRDSLLADDDGAAVIAAKHLSVCERHDENRESPRY